MRLIAFFFSYLSCYVFTEFCCLFIRRGFNFNSNQTQTEIQLYPLDEGIPLGISLSSVRSSFKMPRQHHIPLSPNLLHFIFFSLGILNTSHSKVDFRMSPPLHELLRVNCTWTGNVNLQRSGRLGGKIESFGRAYLLTFRRYSTTHLHGDTWKESQTDWRERCTTTTSRELLQHPSERQIA